MKRVSRLVVALLLGFLPWKGQAEHRDSLWWNRSMGYVVPIDEIAIEADRPKREIGQQETQLDQQVLHDNIAATMADVLTFHSSIFVKQYGRASLSTVAFRGTSSAHTQVTWNGLKIHSPMLGSTDFSLIPAHFIDHATLLHGSSSVSITGGGLGGAIQLESRPTTEPGWNLQFVQGIGSYTTFDEYLRVSYHQNRWALSTRVAYTTSQNDFHYTNYKRKENSYNEEHQIIGSYYPTEVNRQCDFSDLHLQQEIAYQLANGDQLRLDAWYLHSRRGVPMLMVNFGQERDFLNEQRERTLRTVASWRHLRSRYKLEARGGYIYSHQRYDYQRDLGNGEMNPLIASRNQIHTLYTEAIGEYYANQWLFTGSLSHYRHWVESWDACSLSDKNYDRSRGELSALLSAKWSPTPRLGLSLSLREELYGKQWSPLIPAFATDFRLLPKGDLWIKGSISRNYRFPSLNDLYYQPGGNPELKPERGITYDLGVRFSKSREGHYAVSGSVTWFDSYIDDWILWQPTGSGYWSPKNLKKVHAYGIEIKADWRQQLSRDWQFHLTGSGSWTPSINKSDPLNEFDQSVGKQLVYIPQYAASVGASLIWRTWRLSYRGNYYSQRFTSTDNDQTSPLGVLQPYFISDLTIEKRHHARWADLSGKVQIKNLFDIEYESVLARPMPGIHFELFFEICPQWGKKQK